MSDRTFRIRVFDFSTGDFRPGVIVIGPPTHTIGYHRSHRTGLFTLTLVSSALRTYRQEIVVAPSLFRSRDIAGIATLTEPELKRLGFDTKRKEVVAA